MLRRSKWSSERPRLVCVLLAAVTSNGCTTSAGEPTPTDFVEVDESCGLKGMFASMPGSEQVAARCSEAVANALGLKWSSFGDAPREFEVPDSRAEGVVAGALVALDAGSLDIDTIASEGPEGFAAQFLPASEESEGIGGAWLSWVASASTSVQGWEDAEPDLDMAYRGGVILVGDILDQDPPADNTVIWTAGMNALPLPAVMAVLSHEASHAVYGAHIECEDPGISGAACDQDVNGAYYTGAVWLRGWIDAYAPDADSRVCVDSWWFLSDTCRHINDRDGARACDLPELTCG